MSFPGLPNVTSELVMLLSVLFTTSSGIRFPASFNLGGTGGLPEGAPEPEAEEWRDPSASPASALLWASRSRFDRDTFRSDAPMPFVFNSSSFPGERAPTTGTDCSHPMLLISLLFFPVVRRCRQGLQSAEQLY